jgi:hypothetical protein
MSSKVVSGGSLKFIAAFGGGGGGETAFNLDRQTVESLQRDPNFKYPKSCQGVTILKAYSPDLVRPPTAKMWPIM